MLLILLCVAQNVLQIQSSKILTIIPTASYSHHSPFQPLWRELALRGHHVTVLTTDPQKDESLTNLREIDMSYTYEIYKKHNVSDLLSDDSKSFMEMGKKLGIVFREAQHAQLSSAEVQELIHNKNYSFDLLIVEAQTPGMLSFAWRFQCPIIGVASLDSAMQYHDSMGNPIHPVLNPDYNLEVGEADEMTFLERFLSFIYIAAYKNLIYHKTFPAQYEIAKQYFGEDLPPLIDIQNNMSLLFVGTHPLFHNLRPLNLNTITLGGGMHIKQQKPLPEGLKQFLDGADNGVIYFSLGSNVKSKTMSNEFKKAIIGAFAEIPYKVLMKIDGELEDHCRICITMLFKLLCVVLQILGIHSARILTIIPTAFSSHHSPFQPLWRELALRGHQLTVLTTDPQKNTSLINLKEIDMSYTYDIYRKYNFTELLSSTDSIMELGSKAAVMFDEVQHTQLSSPEVQELIHNKNIHFDLLMIEAQSPELLGFAWRFQCPTIAITTLDCAMQYHDSLGNPIHPVINPDFNLEVGHPEEMGFADRLRSFLFIPLYKYFMYHMTYPRIHNAARKFFGDDLPPLKEIQDNISMLFISTHPLFHNIRPLNPNTITIGGGMHIRQPKPLPEDLKKFLDGAENGAIYFALGGNVNCESMSNEFRKTLVDAFAQIPYKVLIKIDCQLGDISSNVLVQKWVPQQDILRHRNVKLFITHGGILSLQEAVINNIPVIGIPFFGDQKTNLNKIVKWGSGIKLDRRKLSKNVLLYAINEVINNPKYREKAREMGDIYRDEEIPSLQRAIYWTEYVIRNKGARHLRSLAVKMPAWKYYMLDVIAFLTSIVLLITFVCYLALKFFFRSISRLSINKFSEKKYN
nr:UDP-glucuronosyltransferase 2B20-like [Leptinotarsa decemlineata]